MSEFRQAIQQAIDELRSSPHYKELADYEPPFNPFEIVGAAHRELIHSSALAWLLRDEENKEFRQKFVAKIVEIATDKGLEIKFSPPDASKDCRFEKVCVKTEHSCKIGTGEKGRIDVFAKFETLKLIIGIEVKIWAGEGLGQIGLYQTFLKEEYPQDEYEKVVVFLTPGGYPSKTKSGVLNVPVLEMSWSDIAWMIKEMRSEPGNANSFRMQFSQHLDRNFPVNKEQRIVHELLSQGDNLKIIKNITSNIPSNGSLDDKEMIKEIVGEDSAAEMVQKIIDNRSSLQTSLEYEFWRELKKQLQSQPKLRDEKIEFQLYKSGVLEAEVIEDERLKEYIRWRDATGSLGLTFRIPYSSLDDGYEVVCRITYDPNSYVYYGFVLCKEDNIEHRVEIDKNHEEYLNLYRDLLEKKIFNHGPEEKNGWLGWKLRADVNIYFANGPALFDTLVDIKERKDEDKENIVKKLAEEICGVTKEISEKTEQWKNRPS